MSWGFIYAWEYLILQPATQIIFHIIHVLSPFLAPLISSAAMVLLGNWRNALPYCQISSLPDPRIFNSLIRVGPKFAISPPETVCFTNSTFESRDQLLTNFFHFLEDWILRQHHPGLILYQIPHGPGWQCCRSDKLIERAILNTNQWIIFADLK